MVKFRRLIIAALATSLAHAGNLPPEACVRLLREARIASDAGRRDEALALVNRAVEEYPKETIPVIALVQLNRDGSPEAATSARERLRLRLFDPESALPVSAIRYLSEDPKAQPKEIALLRDAVNAALLKAPSDSKLLEAAYRLDFRLDDYEGALTIVDRQLALKAERELVWRRLDLCTVLKRWDDAAASARRILEATPNAELARIGLIEALIQSGKLDDARLEIDTFIGATGARTMSARSELVPLAWAYWDAGRADDARATFRKALELDPKAEEAKSALDLLFATPEERLSRAAKADDHWAGEEDPGALFEEGTKRLAAGDATSAFDLLTRAVAADGSDDVWQYNLAMAAIKLERWSDAESALKASIARRPDRAQSYLQLGRVLAAENKCEAALAPLDRALALRGDLNEAHFYRYKCFEKLGRTADAAKEAEVYKAGKAIKP
jgi:tetratricopeptide (TPR) repeat protein